jgi:hypothetical protein
LRALISLYLDLACISVPLTAVAGSREQYEELLSEEKASCREEPWQRGGAKNETKHYGTKIESDGRIIELKAFRYEIYDIIITGQAQGGRKEAF